MTVRFANVAHKIVEDAAAREQVPLAQYVREAALMRVTWEHGLLQGRGEFEMTPEDWLEAIRELREMVELVDAREVAEVSELTSSNGDS